MLNRPPFRPRPSVTINRVDAVNENEVYLSGLSGSPVALNRTSLWWHLFANELRDAQCNVLLLGFGEIPALGFSSGFYAPQIFRIEKQCDVSRRHAQMLGVHSRGSRNEFFGCLIPLLGRFVRPVLLEYLRNFDSDLSSRRGYDKKIGCLAFSQLARWQVVAQVSKASKVLAFDFFSRIRFAITPGGYHVGSFLFFLPRQKLINQSSVHAREKAIPKRHYKHKVLLKADWQANMLRGIP